VQSAAVFLDRDGTLIEDRGDLGAPREVAFFPDTMHSLRALGRHFQLFLVTNQPAVAAGRLTEAQVSAVNRHVVDELARAGVVIRDVYVCPHRRGDGCSCIKPEPGHLQRAAHEHGIDLCRSYTIGDHPHDVELARRVGATGVYVLTGHGMKHRPELGSGHVVVPSIGAAARVILEDRATDANDEVSRAARILRHGGLVAFPTETVYGLGASALDPRAATRIFAAKRRPAFDPLIVHLAERDAISDLVTHVPQGASELMARFWPGPLTLVLPKREVVPDIVTAGLPTVGLRVPDHPLARELLRRAVVPVCAPSANPFGYVSPTTKTHVVEQLGHEVDAILDGGPCQVGIESSIVGWEDGEPVLLRPGGVPREQLEAVVGTPLRSPRSGPRMVAPGMLERHYSPAVRLSTFRGEVPAPPSGRVALLLLAPRTTPSGYAAVEHLSRDGNLGEVARNLFAALRRIDDASVDFALAELAPDEGLGLAVNDRLARAAARPSGPKEP
jgi:L-threonylcarbamoyladenylate synthase